MSKSSQLVDRLLEAGGDVKDLIMQHPQLETYEVVFGVPSDEITRIVRAPKGLTSRMVRAALGIEEQLANIHVHLAHPDHIVDLYTLPSPEAIQNYEQELIDGGIIEPGE